MLLRLAYLAVTNISTLLRLLRMSDREKGVEILARGTDCPSSNARSQACSTASPWSSWAAAARVVAGQEAVG